MNIKVNAINEYTRSQAYTSDTKWFSSYKIKIKSKQVTMMSINIINVDASARGIIMKPPSYHLKHPNRS